METRADIAIIGGGAAGLAAAIAAAQAFRNSSGKQPTQEAGRIDGAQCEEDAFRPTKDSARVVILEASDRVGRSILATGNGRCNFSNAYIAEGPAICEYHNASFVRDVYTQLNRVFPEPDFNDPVLDFFETLGLEWRQEEDGRRFPLANKASVVLDVLRAEAARLGVEEVCGCDITCIEAPREAGKPYTLQTSEGEFWRANAVVVAVGGAVVEKLQITSALVGTLPPQGVRNESGHMHAQGQSLVLKPTVPVLGPLAVAEADKRFTRELDNIRVRCCVSLFREQDGTLIHQQTETGELLFRPYGVSGICVYNLSRLAQPGDYLQINFLQVDDISRARDYIEARYAQLMQHLGAPPTYDQFMRGAVVPRVSDALCKRAGIDPATPVKGEAGIDALYQALCLCTLQVADGGPVDQCQVHRGGFAVEGFDAKSLQFCAQPGLFAAGEALDVDGPCGGFNLHWAWASGLLAGHAAAALLSSAPHVVAGEN